MKKVAYVVKEVVEWILAFAVVMFIIALVYVLIGWLVSIGFNNTIGKAFGVSISLFDTAVAVWCLNIAYQIWDTLFGKGIDSDYLIALSRGRNNPANSLPNLGRRSGTSSGCCKDLR